MEIDIDFAKYIISLQSIARGERDVDPLDDKYKDIIELNFPCIKEARIKEEFENWVWANKVGKNPQVVKLHKQVMKGYSFNGAQSSNIINKYDDLKKSLFNKYIYSSEVFKEYQINKSIKKLKT